MSPEINPNIAPSGRVIRAVGSALAACALVSCGFQEAGTGATGPAWGSETGTVSTAQSEWGREETVRSESPSPQSIEGIAPAIQGVLETEGVRSVRAVILNPRSLGYLWNTSSWVAATEAVAAGERAIIPVISGANPVSSEIEQGETHPYTVLSGELSRIASELIPDPHASELYNSNSVELFRRCLAAIIDSGRAEFDNGMNIRSSPVISPSNIVTPYDENHGFSVVLDNSEIIALVEGDRPDVPNGTSLWIAIINLNNLNQTRYIYWHGLNLPSEYTNFSPGTVIIIDPIEVVPKENEAEGQGSPSGSLLYADTQGGRRFEPHRRFPVPNKRSIGQDPQRI